MRRWAAAVLALSCAFSSGMAIAQPAAQEPPASPTLSPGKGSALTMARCSICHDITHVTRTRLSRDEWDDNIKVMIARGMPIEPHEIPIIVEYLSTYYNRDTPPPASRQVPAVTVSSEARPVQQLLSDYACTACHAIDKKLVGPSFREVATRYKDDSGAAARLLGKIKDGGAGAWGPVPMPPHPQIAADDLKRIVGWVLEQ